MTRNASAASPLPLLLAAAAVTVVMAGLHASASFITPILLAFFFAILVSPVYRWLQRRGLSSGLALLVVVLGIVVAAVGLGLFLSSSAGRLLASLSAYQEQVAARLESFFAWSGAQGLPLDSLRGALNPEAAFSFVGMMVGAVVSLLSTSIIILFTLMFAMVEGPLFRKRLAAGLGEESLLLRKATGFASSMVQFFAIRTRINLLTGAMVVVLLLILRVDFPFLWGVLTFFLSYIPYVGLVLATIPSVLLGFAEGGLVTALLVVLGVGMINVSAENIIAPAMLGRGLSMSPLLVFVAFLFWAWLLGPSGTVLAMPLTILVLMLLDSFDSTRWLAILMGMSSGGQLTAEPDDQPEELA